MDRRCRESEGKAKIEGYMSISDEEAHHRAHEWSNSEHIHHFILTYTMLTYNEHQLPFHIGEYSLKTTSFGFSGLNSKWVSSWPPSSSSTCQPIKPLIKSAALRPLDLNDEMIMIGNTPPSLKAKNNSCPIVPQPKKAPTISYVEDSEIEIVVGPINIPVPSIQVEE